MSHSFSFWIETDYCFSIHSNMFADSFVRILIKVYAARVKHIINELPIFYHYLMSDREVPKKNGVYCFNFADLASAG